MADIELKCNACGTRYRAPRRLPEGPMTCRKCGSVLVDDSPGPKSGRTGQSFGGYTIVESLSEGRRSTIYRAEQLAMRRSVALKSLNEECLSDQAVVNGFLSDARLVAAMRHSNIVSIYDVSPEGAPYLSMELVEGSTVRNMLDERGLPPMTDAVRVAASLGGALAHALRNNARSMRITPDTVMLTDKGEVKVLPSGFSGTADEHSAAEDQAVVALGSILYVLLTGIEPDPAGKIEPPSKLNPEVSDTLDEAVLRMLKGREKGYSSVVAATRELKRLAGSRRSIDRKVEDTFKYIQQRKATSSRRTLILAVGLCVACAAVITGVYLYLSGQQHKADLLNRINYCISNDDYSGLVEAGEQFVEEYPSHARAREIGERVETARKLARAAERLEEARDAITKVIVAAENAPHLVKKYHGELDAIAGKFSELETVVRLVEANKIRVERIWANKLAANQREMKKAAKDRNYAGVRKRIEALQNLLLEPGAVESEKTTDYVKKLPAWLDKAMNERFIHICNNLAFNLEQDGKIEEAIELYQDIVDNWGDEKFAELAQKRIDRLLAADLGNN